MVPWKVCKEWCCKLVTPTKFLSTRVSGWLRLNHEGIGWNEKCIKKVRICWSNFSLWSLKLASWRDLVPLPVNGGCLKYATIQLGLTVLLTTSATLIQHIHVAWNAISYDKHELLNAVTAASTKLWKYRTIHKIFERTSGRHSSTSSKIHKQIWQVLKSLKFQFNKQCRPIQQVCKHSSNTVVCLTSKDLCWLLSNEHSRINSKSLGKVKWQHRVWNSKETIKWKASSIVITTATILASKSIRFCSSDNHARTQYTWQSSVRVKYPWIAIIERAKSEISWLSSRSKQVTKCARSYERD